MLRGKRLSAYAIFQETFKKQSTPLQVENEFQKLNLQSSHCFYFCCVYAVELVCFVDFVFQLLYSIQSALYTSEWNEMVDGFSNFMLVNGDWSETAMQLFVTIEKGKINLNIQKPLFIKQVKY